MATNSIASLAAAVTSSTTGTATATNKASIAQNFDSFLQLLTTQLKNQNRRAARHQPVTHHWCVRPVSAINMTSTPTLVALQKRARPPPDELPGSTATVDGSTAKLAAGKLPEFSTASGDRPSITNSNRHLSIADLRAQRRQPNVAGRPRHTTVHCRGSYNDSTAKDARRPSRFSQARQVESVADADPPVLISAGSPIRSTRCARWSVGSFGIPPRAGGWFEAHERLGGFANAQPHRLLFARRHPPPWEDGIARAGGRLFLFKCGLANVTAEGTLHSCFCCRCVRVSMTEPHRPRVKYVIGPDGSPLTIADLPAPGTKRWVIRRKAEVVAAVRGGLLSLEEACSRYTLTVEEFLAWQYSIDRHGLAGLRTTRIQQYRQ